MLRSVTEPLTLTQLNVFYCRGNAAGFGRACHSYALKPTSPAHAVYGELVNGQRLPGGTKLRYMDHIRRILYKCNISISNLEQLSSDRDSWKSACARGLSIHTVWHQIEVRRSRRHSPPNPPTTCPRCPQCSRICASEFGLRSHLYGVMSHVHISNTPSSTNVIVGLLQASKQAWYRTNNTAHCSPFFIASHCTTWPHITLICAFNSYLIIIGLIIFSLQLCARAYRAQKIILIIIILITNCVAAGCGRHGTPRGCKIPTSYAFITGRGS